MTNPHEIRDTLAAPAAPGTNPQPMTRDAAIFVLEGLIATAEEHADDRANEISELAEDNASAADIETARADLAEDVREVAALRMAVEALHRSGRTCETCAGLHHHDIAANIGRCSKFVEAGTPFYTVVWPIRPMAAEGMPAHSCAAWVAKS